MYNKSKFYKKNSRTPRSSLKKNSNILLEKKERKNYVLDTIVKAVATGIFIFSIILNVVLIMIIIVISVSQKSKLSFQNKDIAYKKEYIKGNSSKSKSFVIIDINGVISENQSDGFHDFASKESMVEGVKNRLKLIEKTPDVKGIILLINSPGGTVTASDMIYHEVKKFKEEHSLPIITYIKDIGASGAYYVASSTDYIISYPTAITGSIGVIIYNFNFKNLMDKYGVRYIAIKSGKHKDLISPFKEIDPEEVKWMQGIVNELLERFVDIVKLNRENLSMQQVRNLADGRVYTASMAKKVGLIDEVGYFDDALKYLEKITDVKSYSVYRYVKQKQFKSLFDLIAKVGSFIGYKRYSPFSDNGTNKNNGIKTYYLMNYGYGDALDIELY